MGKAERNRAQNARQRIALQQQAARRAEAQRRAFIVGGSVLAVIVIVVAIVVIKSLHKTSAAPTASSTTTAKTVPTVATEITSVPAAVLNKVGAGPSDVAPLKTITDKALTMNGKPEVLYMGAEYCPYCAAERWALAEALSRFGTFSNLHFIHSSSTDVYAATPTLTFYQSTYTSKYLTFDPIALETVSEAPLQKADAAQTALINKYTQGQFPFVDVGGKFIVDGAQYLPSTLGTNPTAGDISKTALTWQEVGSDMQNPNSSVAQAILGAANHVTAAICKMTGDQPSTVCKSASVTSIGGDI
jgi:thiol-disulfide isomerase/thioredoxin